MSDQCIDCVSENDHCHGTLIVHLDHVLECTEDGCVVLDSARHDLLLTCDRLGSACDCVPSLPRDERELLSA